MLLTISEVANLFGVHRDTIRRWDKKGLLVPAKRTLGNHRRYDSIIVESLINKMEIDENTQKLTICYSRVSSHDQKADLERQRNKLEEFAKENNFINIKSISDLGSGLNYKKKD